MSQGLILNLKPHVLRWARERASLTVPALAQKFQPKGAVKFEAKIIGWEQSGEISWSNAEKLAKHAHIPFGYLFLSEPLVEKLPIKDFRTVKTRNIPRPSPELLDVVHAALLRQDWYRDYMISNDASELTFVGSLKLSKDIIGAADRIREVVRWDLVLNEKVRTSEQALALRIKAVEDARILVMRSKVVGNTTRKLSVDEFRGFTLADKYAPLIFINESDAKAAQMFTLAHELVHLWIGESGISNLRQTYAPKIPIETFCNAVAGELLVPTEKLNELWPLVNNPTEGIEQLTKIFRVSSFVLLRRLRDIKALSKDEFELRWDTAEKEAAFKKKTSSGYADFYRLLQTRLGTRFASALVESTLEGETPYRTAIQLIGTNDTEVVRKLAVAMGAFA